MILGVGVQGKRYLKKDAYRGLNAMISAPLLKYSIHLLQLGNLLIGMTVCILMPISNDEIYSNPQLVQAPGY